MAPPKTHLLKVVAGAETIEREVASTERLLWAERGDLRSWKVSGIDVFTVKPSLDREAMVLTMSVDGRADIHRVEPGARVELGDAKWPVSQLASFELAPIPKPPEPVKPYKVGTFRVWFYDGSSSLLESVDRWEDLSDWVFVDGTAQPPEQVTS